MMIKIPILAFLIPLIPSFGVFSLLSFDDAFAWLGFDVK